MSKQMNKKKIDIVGIVGLPACYGGFESLVQNLVDYQSDNIKYKVYCSSKAYYEKNGKYKNATLKYLPFKANGISSIPYDILGLFLSMFRNIDVMLVLGVSGCIYLPIFRFFSSAKIVTNIDGLEWKRDKWGQMARRFLKLSEKMAIQYSDIIIADNEAISQYILSEYGVVSKVIAYGGDHAVAKNTLPDHKDDYFLTVCRIEPENNIAMILEAFSKTAQYLKFVGNWNSSVYGCQLKEKYSNLKNIDLIDPIYDVEKLFELRSKCKGYIHGHSAGGTNPSLVEAMHFCTPVIAFDCDFNRFSTEGSAFYFKSVEELVSILLKKSSHHFNNDDDTCAKSMREIALRRYTWEIITKMYEDLY